MGRLELEASAVSHPPKGDREDLGLNPTCPLCWLCVNKLLTSLSRSLSFHTRTMRLINMRTHMVLNTVPGPQKGLRKYWCC